MPEIEFVTVTPRATHNHIIKPDETQGADLHVVNQVENKEIKISNNEGKLKSSKNADNSKNHGSETALTASEQSAIDNSKLIDAVVNDLVLSELNPRQIVSDDEIEMLAQSIRSVGCIQNLIGLEVDGKIEIVAGGRRLRALKKIIAEDNTPLRTEKVRVTHNKNEALAMAGAENHARLKPNPVDEIITYKQAADNGAAPNDIAKAFGQTVRHVKGRLKLAKLSPILLDALRSQEITLDVAAAYAFTDDQKEQENAYSELCETWKADRPSEIIGFLTDSMTAGTDSLAAFVTREAYESAGGTVTENLFGDDIYFNDLQLLDKLAREQMNIVEGDAIKNGWKWAEFRDEAIYSYDLKGATWLQPLNKELSEMDKAELELLEEFIDEGNPTENQENRYNELTEQMRETYYSEEMMKHCGVYYWLDYHGEMRSRLGILLDEDKPTAIDAGLIKVSEQTPDLNPNKSSQGTYLKALRKDLTTVRTATIQTAIMEDQELAYDILVFSLAYKEYSGRVPFEIECKKMNCILINDDGLNVSDKLIRAGGFYQLEGDEIAVAFTKFRKLPKAEKERVMTENVASSFYAQLSDSIYCTDMTEVIADTTKANPRDIWTPTAAFFKRLKSEQLDEILAYVNDKPVSSGFKNDKKANKVRLLDHMFNDEDKIKGYSIDKQTRIRTWLPEGLENRPDNVEWGDTQATH